MYKNNYGQTLQAQPPPSNYVDAGDGSYSNNDFVKTATEGSAFEIQSSELALQAAAKAASSNNTPASQYLRKVAETIVKDHSAANQRLIALAHKTKFADSIAQTLTPLHKVKIQELLLLLSSIPQGPGGGPASKAFDCAYYGIQLGAHQEAIAYFKNFINHDDQASHISYAQGHDHNELVAFAKQTLPKLQHHLSLVEQGMQRYCSSAPASL